MGPDTSISVDAEVLGTCPDAFFPFLAGCFLVGCFPFFLDNEGDNDPASFLVSQKYSKNQQKNQQIPALKGVRAGTTTGTTVAVGTEILRT